MICGEKHTAFQPTDAQWKCPACGADGDYFYIEEPANDRDEDCGKLHENDEILCHKCHYAGDGKTTAKKMMKLHGCEVCPNCKGTGTVKKQ